jgi:hypothetical protein
VRNKVKIDIIALVAGSLIAAGVIITASIMLGYGELSFFFAGALYLIPFFLVLSLAHIIANKFVSSRKSYLVYGAPGFLLPVLIFLSVYLLLGTSAGLVDGIVGFGIAGCFGALAICAIVRQSA